MMKCADARKPRVLQLRKPKKRWRKQRRMRQELEQLALEIVAKAAGMVGMATAAGKAKPIVRGAEVGRLRRHRRRGVVVGVAVKGVATTAGGRVRRIASTSGPLGRLPCAAVKAAAAVVEAIHGDETGAGLGARAARAGPGARAAGPKNENPGGRRLRKLEKRTKAETNGLRRKAHRE